MVVEDFIVQRREEFRETHLLFRRAISSSVSQNDISNRIEVQPNESNNYQVGFSFLKNL